MRRRQTRRRRRSSETIFVFRRVLVVLIFLLVVGGIVFLVIKLTGGTGEGKGPQSADTGTPMPEDSVALPELTPTPEPKLPDTLQIQMSSAEYLQSIGFDTDIMVNREEVASFRRQEDVYFGKDTEFTDVEGIITFGGNNWRNTFTYGTVQLTNKTMTRIWECPTGSLATESNGTWTGSGWTGMPVIVRWDPEVRKVLGIYDEFKNMDGFTEVIYPTMDGHIYFFELTSGRKTREPMDIGVVTKGTASLDPRGYPLLYTGQGIASTKADGNTGAWFRVISLIENKVLWDFGGKDPWSHRDWQAYDSSALVDAETDTLFAPGENGILYSCKLNTVFDLAAGTVSVSPSPLEKYRYTANGYGEGNTERWWGIENSMSVWRNYGFFTDNGGYLQCVDLNTLELMYVTDVLDDSDTSSVIEEDYDANTFYIYTANEVDKQQGVANNLGTTVHRKINGLTGEIVWKKEYPASIGNTSSNGGTLATPHVGRGNISDIVIYASTLLPVTVNGETMNGGRIVAYRKSDGAELWRFEQAAGYWSSPVVVYDDNGDGYLIQCDRSGMMRMYDPRTGALITELDMGSRIESTPSVFGNYLVVGTRGQYGSGEPQKIICVQLG